MQEQTSPRQNSGSSSTLLLRILEQPVGALQLSLGEWDQLLRTARRYNLLARLSAVIKGQDLTAKIPQKPRAHLVAAQTLAEKHKRDVEWEVQCLSRVLQPIDTPIVLLKGAAYAAAGLPISDGRLFGDIDIMVRKVRLDGVEAALRSGGWVSIEHNAYNQHYYRTWMHQLPPMMHFTRGTVVDVHHTIVPQTARASVAPTPLFDALVPIAGSENLFVLSPADMVLHSAVHLFNEGEFDNGLRDLADLDGLLRHFAQTQSFFDSLLDRARDLGLLRPLAYACIHATELLRTPVPPMVIQQLQNQLKHPASRTTSALMRRALLAPGTSDGTVADALANGLLYLRGHAMRMPLHLLVPHLVRKALQNDQQ